MPDVSLKEYMDSRFSDFQDQIDRRFRDQDASTTTALASAEKAVDKAESAGEKWRENANEWRSAMTDRERNFLSRKEFYVMIGTAVAITTLLITIWALNR